MQMTRWWNGFGGLIAGLALAAAFSQYWLHAGTSLPALTGLAVMCLASAVIASAVMMKWRDQPLVRSALWFLVSAWMVILPNVYTVCTQWLTTIGVDFSQSLVAQIGHWSLLAFAGLVVPTVGVIGLSRARPSLFGLSTAGAIIVAAVGVMNHIGPDGCGLVAALGGASLFLRELLQWSRSGADKKSRPSAQAHSVQSLPFRDVLLEFLALAAVALLWPVMQRFVRQFFPDSIALMLSEWAELISALSVAGWLVTTHRVRDWCVWILSGGSWIWLCLAMSPLFVRGTLWANATISQVWLLHPLRMLMAGMLCAPVALASAALVRSRQSSSDRWANSQSPLSVTVRLAVWIVSATMASWLLPMIGVWTLMVSATSVIVALAAVRLWQLGSVAYMPSNKFGTARIQRLVATCVLIFPVSAPAWVRYQPEVTAKVLFDTNVALASHARVPWSQLSKLDEGRSAWIQEGDRGTLTAWAFSGSRYLVRENGIPKGAFAANAEFAPRLVADVLPSVLPLVVHEHPRNVLLLGLRAGESLNVATAFPVERVVCVEPDRGVVKLCRAIWSRSDSAMFADDDRIAWRVCDPVLATRSLTERFDVIVSNADQPALPQSANGFSVEAFRAVAKRLADGGVFAIRFHHVDFGPRSVRCMAQTMAAAFRQVGAVEMSPGELLFLGTNDDRGFARDGFIDRWQRPHVRQSLAALGWDWATPLRLPLLNHDAVQSLADQPDAVVNVASRSTWPFRLPVEVMRWEPKLQQVRAELDKHARFLMAWGGDRAGDTDVATRLSEWDLSRRIISRNADEFWAYRKSVKEHMTQSPRSLIQQVGGTKTESGLHPDDDRRLRYFRAVGDAARKPEPSEVDLDRIRRFESPFDPLITPFLNQEIVELAARSDQMDSARQLRHRLPAIYFSTNADRSIRNVADALQFVNSHPQAIADPGERFDQLNGLLQMLLNRWSARGEFQATSSKLALHDIERSIDAAETTLVTMRSLARSGAVNSYDWSAREQFLERRLVRPLRTYRSAVVRQSQAADRKRDMVEQSDAAP